MKLRFRKLIHVALLVGVTAALTGFIAKPPASNNNSLWVELDPTKAAEYRINVPSLSPLIKRAEPAVLVVTTESVVKQRSGMPPGFENDPFGDLFPFFGPKGRTGEQKMRGQGSGFIIHPSGYALTNNHVVEGATSIKVKVGSDLREYTAKVVGADEATDIALIKIESKNTAWPVISLGRSSEVEVGDRAVAIGNPLGLELSVSSGIISAKGRRDVHPNGRRGLFDFMQIDAPINPGNSGGPLLNLSGEAIGINTAMASGQGIGFAIPIDMVKQILPQLKETGKASRSWLGVQVEAVSDDLAKAIGLSLTHGALVREVVAESPAAKAGVEPGDVITQFDGKLVEGPNSLQVSAGLAGAGKSVPLTVFRAGQTKLLRVTLEKLPNTNEEQAPALSKENAKDIESIGIALVDLDATARQQLGLDVALKGARITAVQPRSIAAASDLRPNDVIIKINDQTVGSAKDATRLIAETKSTSLLRILLKRQKATLFVVIPKP